MGGAIFFGTQFVIFSLFLIRNLDGVKLMAMAIQYIESLESHSLEKQLVPLFIPFFFFKTKENHDIMFRILVALL